MSFPKTGEFSPYAVTTRSGPHVTIQAGVEHAGRFWTTTSRNSLKAKSIRAHRTAAAVLGHGKRTRVVAGTTVALDAHRPFDALSDPLGALFSGGAVLRLGVSQVRQLVGYLETLGEIPSSWYPQRRVLLVTDIDRSVDLQGCAVRSVAGAWDRTPVTLRPTDRDPVPLPRDELPASHTGLLDGSHPVRLGVQTDAGPVALPATWLPRGPVVVSADALALIGADLDGPGCITFDASTSRRPGEKRGAMFRGQVSLLAVDGHSATVNLTTEKITTWDGFEAATTELDRTEPVSA